MKLRVVEFSGQVRDVVDAEEIKSHFENKGNYFELGLTLDIIYNNECGWESGNQNLINHILPR